MGEKNRKKGGRKGGRERKREREKERERGREKDREIEGERGEKKKGQTNRQIHVHVRKGSKKMERMPRNDGMRNDNN